MRISVIIAAAGIGKRMGADGPKQYLKLAGRPVICHTLDRFRGLSELVAVAPPGGSGRFRTEIIEQFGYPGGWRVVDGGKERQDSVRNGLGCILSDCDVVLIHDGVRPFISGELIDEVAKRAYDTGAAIVAAPVKDTIKRVDSDGLIFETVDRSPLWRALTPQAFRPDVVRGAFERAYSEGVYTTDEASLVERMGTRVAIVPGDDRNLKITTPEDLAIAESLLVGDKR